MAGLRLEGVSTRALQPVDLGLAPGELVLLSGPSGSGKSLLLRAVADLDPNEGEVWLDGSARSATPAPLWRRRVGLLPAESHWWGELVGDHFSAGAEALLRSLGFGPDVLGWSVGRLSTGERQRLALARMLALSPQALLLDEATANLDPPNRERVEGIIGSYRVERCAPVLWVSHDPAQRERLSAPEGARRLVIRDGGLEPETEAGAWA
jgi:ABC-type iron transport system FetAB ATPase subunit